MATRNDILLWVGAYLFIATIFFGVICAALDKEDKWKPDLSTIVVSSLIWPLTLVAAISYKIAQWLTQWFFD